ncbi:MAG TPA: class I SAM-dependent methyltransferase [Gammaproteobacteria bacterium]|nr:class I SAM-dependent methyltransferase [Gammaproteobacteria bacterium]
MVSELTHYRARAKFLNYMVGKFNFWDWVVGCYDFSRAKSILDVNCTTGDFWTHVHGNLPLLEKVTLTDTSEEMLSAARETLANSPLFTKMNFELAEAAALTYADQSFDVVVTHDLMLRVHKSIPQSIQAMARVLRKEGWAGIITLNMRSVREILGLANKIDSRFPARSVVLEQFDEIIADKLLPKYFNRIQKYSDEAIMRITDSEVIMGFIRTHPVSLSLGLKEDFFTTFKGAIDNIIAQKGFLETAITPTLYICKGTVK